MTARKTVQAVTCIRERLARESGVVLIVVMAFVAVFAATGAGLYWLVSSQTNATELERTDVKAFNVAEAGIDAGMLALKLNWPDAPDKVAAVDNDILKTVIQQNSPGLWDPKRSNPSEFIQVEIYDNVDASGNTTSVANPDPSTRVYWDSNKDGLMFVDSTANVDDDRHRILILAQRQYWDLTFPVGLALWSGVVDSNGQGLYVTVEDPNPAPYVPYAFYDVHDAQGKKISAGYAVAPAPSASSFNEVFPESLRAALEAIAREQGTYFTSDTQASAFLASGQAGGKVVYIKSNSAVTISGDKRVGSKDSPVVVIIDTPDNSENVWDFRGTADFYGVLVTIGNSTLRGTSGIHGALYCSGTLLNKGTGSSGEINYNQTCIQNINRQYTISVNIVPNTWEEYTLPRSQ
ncbi:MAG: hypothetical protein N3B14_05920 [Thermoleophilia bacterium]|nr:hypothetical protein [Thermoleophilia bacterium]